MIKSLQLAIVCWLLMTAQAASAQIDLNFSTVSPACHGTTNGSATVITAGGIAPLTYLWDNGQTTQTNQGIGAGTYEVTVTDAANMTASGTVTVFEPNQLTLEIVVTNIPCATDPLGGAVNAVILGGTLPYSIVWNDGDTDVSRQNLPAGNYAATVTDGNGCTASDEGTIQIPPPLEVVTVAITPSCGGANNGSATVVPSGGTGPYTHTWTPGGYTGSTVTGLAPGQYYVCTFDANHCQKDLWVIIPEITGLNVNLSVLSAACTGIDNGVVTAFVDPPGNYVYNWNLPPFTGVNQLTGLPADIVVSVTVTDPVSGCTGSATTTVSAHSSIDVIVTDTDIPCAGENIGQASANAFGGVPDYTYVWLLPPSGPVIGNGPNINGLAPGAYMVSVTDSQGCTAIGVADIGVESAPDAIIGGPTVVECGDSLSILQFVNLSVDPFDSIATWNWTITTATDTFHFGNVSPLELALPVGDSGTVQLVVTSLNGCTDTATQHFVVPGIPDISLSTGAMAMVCGNGPVDIVVNGGHPWYSYVWSPLTGLTLDSIPPNATANPSVTTTYQLIASDQGCSDTVSVIIVRKPLVEIGVDTNLIETCDSLVVLNAHANVSKIFWVDSIGTFLGFNPITVVAGAPATYTAIAMDSLGCMDSVSVTVIGHPHITLTTDAMMMDCHNDPVHIVVNGGSPSFTYVWSPMTGLTLDTPAPNVIADPDTTTTYQLIASNDEGCSDTVYVTVIRVIPIELTIDTNLIVTCDSLVVLNAHSNVDKVFWIDAQGNVLGNNPITVVAGDTMEYTAIAMDTTGCMDSISVVVIGLPNIHITTDSILLDCDNGPVHIVVNGADPGYTYVWSPMTGLTLDAVPPNATADPDSTTTYQLIASSGTGCADTITVTVIRVVPIELSVEQEVIVTCDSTVVLQATSNVADVCWIDSNGTVIGGGANPVTVVVQPGVTVIYTAIAKDTTGCRDSLSVSVTGHSVDIDIDPANMGMGCVGEDIPLGVINNHPNDTLHYQWTVTSPLIITSSSITSSITVSGPAGMYEVTVTAINQFGCIQTLLIPVKISDRDTLDAGDISLDLCDGRKVSFFNNSGYDGVWTFGDGDTSLVANPMHMYDTAGVYVVTFTPLNAICVLPWDSTITVLQEGLAMPVITNDYVICVDSAQIQFHGTSNNPNVTWAWTFENGTPPTSTLQNPLVSFQAEDTITATLKVTDINGCMADTSQEVIIQFIDDFIQDTLMFCIDTTVQLNADGFDTTATYSWTAVPFDSTLVSTDKNPTVSPDVVTVYTVTITQGLLCSTTYQVTVIPLEAADLQLQPDTTVCNNTPLSITASGNGLGYEWSESPVFDTIFANVPTVLITPVRNGIYYVRTSSIAGCVAVDSIKINNGSVAIQPEPFDGNICAGEETGLLVVNLIGGDTLTYVWTPTLPGTPGQTVTPTESTNYQVVVTNQFGCKDTLGFQVNVSTISVDATVTGPSVLHQGESTTLLATPSGTGVVVSYEWSPADGLSDPNIPNPTATPNQDQVYEVTVTTADGCTATDTVQIRVIPNQCIEPYIFVPTAFTPNNDSNNDFFIVRGDNITELYFVVWDRWGEKVYETTDINAKGWDGTYKGNELTPDAFAWYIRARCENGEVYEKKGDVTLMK